ALRDVVGMVIGQGHHAGAELDAPRAIAGDGEEHLRRGDHLPAGGMMLAAPELVVAELVELDHEIEVALELQHRMLADGMVRGEEGTELETGHERLRRAGKGFAAGKVPRTAAAGRSDCATSGCGCRMRVPRCGLCRVLGLSFRGTR